MSTHPVVLLVEDDPDDEALTRRAIQRSGIEVTLFVAHDGAEALELLIGGEDGSCPSQLKAMPTVVLLDMKLPKYDGLEVLRRVRENPRMRALPIVMLTSSNEESDVRQAYALGANSYIRKPVDFREFADAITQISAYWLRINQSPMLHGHG